jgi:hypothetical protein
MDTIAAGGVGLAHETLPGACWSGSGLVAGVVVARDQTQKKHALMRNHPLIAHARYWLETIGPGLRQYIVTGNDEERPFSRDQRSWIYASSKQENNYSGSAPTSSTDTVGGSLLGEACRHGVRACPCRGVLDVFPG